MTESSTYALAPDKRVDGWRVALAASSAMLMGVLFHADTARSIVETWRSSDTYAHGFLVVPIAGWLVWRRRAELVAAYAGPFWPGMLLVAVSGFVWMVGRLAGAQVIEQFALVATIQSVALAVLGRRIFRVLAFPLFFLAFAVPFGEAFVPQLIDWTADFTVAALKLTGVPVYRESNHFVVPTGRWSVVEACSGIRYLIASLMAGALYAYVMYRSLWRRVAFVVAAATVPIIANWLRAYLIVMIGHLSGNELAVGVDHLIYGWIFFGIVLGAMFWAGARFRDEPADALGAAGGHRQTDDRALRSQASVVVGALAAVAIVAAWIPAAAVLGSAGDDRPRVLAPLGGANGWTVAPSSAVAWRPRFQGQRDSLHQTFVRGDERVTVHIDYYARQVDGAELINSQNVLVAERDPTWRVTARGETVLDGAVTARTATVESAHTRLVVAWWYWIDGRTTLSDAVAKMLLAQAKLTLRADDSAAIFLVTESGTGADGTTILRRFAADMNPSIERALGHARHEASP